MLNKTVLVIGAHGGLGTKLISLFLDSGYTVITPKHTELDITNAESLNEYFSNTINTYNSQVSLVLNLAVKNIDGFLHKQSAKNIKEQLDVNVIGLTNLLAESLKYFRNNNISGRFITISSILSITPIIGTAIYGASKAYADHLIKTTAKENAAKHITVNSIQLGYFDGGLTDLLPADIKENLINKIPVRRLGNITELYNLIQTVQSTEYINGSTLLISGGL